MRIRRSTHALLKLCSMMIALMVSGHGQAHGGVVLEEDLCIIKIGFYQAHFTIFQPRSQGHEQFCEDLPDLGESVFVLEYLHNGLEALPVDFRIIRNTTNLGRFATWEDVQTVENLQELTEYYLPPVREADVLTVLHQFDKSGEFIGVVTATHPDTNTLYTAVFPFEVGFTGVNYAAIALSLAILTPLLYGLFAARLKIRKLTSGAATAVATLCLMTSADSHGTPPTPQLQSQGTYFRVLIHSALEPITINQIHDWQVRLIDTEGKPVIGATISITGRMPDHDHGLPTNPLMTQSLANGVYLIQGMKFHMAGMWEVQLKITVAHRTDIATVSLAL